MEIHALIDGETAIPAMLHPYWLMPAHMFCFPQGHIEDEEVDKANDISDILNMYI